MIENTKEKRLRLRLSVDMDLCSRERVELAYS
jgi:hypothetical protein